MMLDKSFMATEEHTFLPKNRGRNMTYSDIVHPCPIAVCSLILNIFLPGVGTSVTAFYAPKGIDFYCFFVGIEQSILYYGSICFGFLSFWIGGLPLGLIFAFLIHVWCIVHSYFVVKLWKEKK